MGGRTRKTPSPMAVQTCSCRKKNRSICAENEESWDGFAIKTSKVPIIIQIRQYNERNFYSKSKQMST